MPKPKRKAKRDWLDGNKDAIFNDLVREAAQSAGFQWTEDEIKQSADLTERKALYWYTRMALQQLLTAGEKKPDAAQLLSQLTIASGGKAVWYSKSGVIRWQDANGEKKKTMESTFIRSLLPGWKKSFTVRPKP